MLQWLLLGWCVQRLQLVCYCLASLGAEQLCCDAASGRGELAVVRQQLVRSCHSRWAVVNLLDAPWYSFPRSDAAASTTSTVARLMDTDDAERLDVLVSVDQGGACLLSAFGVFPVRCALVAMHSVVRWQCGHGSAD
jgi:hypothetical protein